MSTRAYPNEYFGTPGKDVNTLMADVTRTQGEISSMVTEFDNHKQAVAGGSIDQIANMRTHLQAMNAAVRLMASKTDQLEAGVKAIEQARDAYYKGIHLKDFVKKNPDSELAAAVKLWGYGPRIVY